MSRAIARPAAVIPAVAASPVELDICLLIPRTIAAKYATLHAIALRFVCADLWCVGFSRHVHAYCTSYLQAASMLQRFYPRSVLRASIVSFGSLGEPVELTPFAEPSSFLATTTPLIARYPASSTSTCVSLATALQRATTVAWRPTAIRVTAFVTNAPCHGTAYHSRVTGNLVDPQPGGDPAGSPESLVIQLIG